MDYKEKIDGIINEAITEKSFSLEIIERIKSLRDGFETAQKRIEDLEKSLGLYQKSDTELRTEKKNLIIKVDAFEQREKSIGEKEAKLAMTEYELKFQKERAQEIKELFSAVFRNPVILRNKTVGHACEGPGGYSGMQTTSTNDSEREEIQ